MGIVDRLVGGSSSLEIIAICGGGGMGKTTLATNAYTHPLVVEHFDIRASSIATISYVRRRIASSLLRSMNRWNTKVTSNSEDELIECLLHNLGRRRYLIFLDDVWSFEVLEWLKIVLPDYGNGSRIIFATRSSDLANSAHYIHEMRFLDEDQTWNLLREKIFNGDPCPFQLESVGKTIARSCRGHPLCIKVVSGILASDQTEAAWEDVSENIKIASEKDGDKVDEILYLSYMYLPQYLRPCLLYMGIFPEYQAIRVSTLVQLWVAEGFVNERGWSGSLEVTGKGYVDDLIMRSLVSINNLKSNGNIKSIKVNDMIRGMCIRQAHIENFNLHFDNHKPRLEVEGIIRTSRRISNIVYSDSFLRGVYGSTIRTLVLNLEYGVLDLRCWIGDVKLLRILDLLNVKSYYSYEEVFELFHLRFLAVHCEFNIPEAISNLENLQTLIILHVRKGGIFDKLPEGIWRMPQLRYVRIICFKFPSVKGPTYVLENLETLSRIVDFVCSRENLKMIPNLKNLALLYTMELRDVVENYELQNLIYLQKLEVLKIETNLSVGEQHKMYCATFPITLKKLSLRGLQLSWEDIKMVASLLPNLEVLKLRNHACIGNTWETSEGGFSQLTYLLIEESNLQHWSIESSHLPRLRWLVLVRCWSLLEVPYEMVEIPTLVLIELDSTNQALLRSAKKIQKDRHSLGHDPLDIYVD